MRRVVALAAEALSLVILAAVMLCLVSSSVSFVALLTRSTNLVRCDISEHCFFSELP